MTRPLAGIKVLDFSEHGFVPSAAAVLADFGADVVKIERLRADAMRGIIASGMVATVDGLRLSLRAGQPHKRGIALDVEAPAGREVFERLVRWADVYVTNQLPRVRRKLRTDPADLFALNPKLVYAEGHGQGQRGDEADAGGYDAVSYWARGGVAHVLTDPAASQPAQQRPALGDLPSGMFFAGGICAALVHALRSGEGIVVDTSLLSGAIWTLARAEDCIFSFYSSPTEVLQDPAALDNGYLMPHRAKPELRLAAAPVQFDDEIPAVRRPGPRLGEYTRDVLAGLGYEPADADRLFADGVVAEPTTA